MTDVPSTISHFPSDNEVDNRPSKRVKMDGAGNAEENQVKDYRVQKGVAAIKPEYLLNPKGKSGAVSNSIDDDAAEGSTLLTSGVKASYGTPRRANAPGQSASRETENDKPEEDEFVQGDATSQHGNSRANGRNGHQKDSRAKGKDDKKNKKKRETGQNTKRQYGTWGDKIQLCPSRQFTPEFSPRECKHGENCKYEHDLRKYLAEVKSKEKIEKFEKCPVWEVSGYCPVGWKCRFFETHSVEKESEDGKKEYLLIEDQQRMEKAGVNEDTKAVGTNVYNVIATKDKFDLERRRVKLERSDQYASWLTDSFNPQQARFYNAKKIAEAASTAGENGAAEQDEDAKADERASFKEPPFRASEKRRLYYGPETPALAPLTTQGNLPFRRLCVDLGAQVTWSEMAMSLPLVQGQKGEWALVKAHESEITPPRVAPKNIVVDYDNAKDMKFGVQIAANKHGIAFKATEALAKYCPKLRAIDLNCGCPIDMLYNSGAGTALLDAHPKLEKMLRGMNALSGEIPVQVKIRMGVKDNQPTAGALVQRLILGGQTTVEHGLEPCGVAAITLHGRSRQQRYTRTANWQYINDIGVAIKEFKAKQDAIADTVREADPRDQANGGKVYFIGNGDIFSHEDYWEHINDANVDACMVGRGALIKPWIFEEIEQQKHLDKSPEERFTYIEKFCRYGMDTWGSDEMGISTTRRFLLEWLSFTHRYVPIGLLERLPAKINEKPPPYKGRNDKETLLASNNYKDWIKISEMFLGRANEGFKFTPKHKSNSYDDIEAEG